MIGLLGASWGPLGGLLGASWGPPGGLLGAPTPFRMLEHPTVSEAIAKFDLQIASETACWPSWRQASAPGRCAGRPGRPPECLNTLRFLGARADLTCKLRMKMHVGRLGVKWAARLIKRSWGAPENIFSAGRKVSQKLGSGGHHRHSPL